MSDGRATTEADVLRRIDQARHRRTPLTADRVTLVHGAGGKASATLVDAIFIDAFGAPDPDELGDAAVLDVAAGRLAYSTDSYVVSPIRFPGASIGELAVNGTVNDLAVAGAQPRWLSAAFILEEGLPVDDLRAVVADMARAAERAGVRIVTGDTKVVPKNTGDQVYITTSGVGVVPPGRLLGARRVQGGDRIVLSGPIGAHGMAVMIARGNLDLKAPIASDSTPVNGWVEAVYAAVPPEAVRWMRDATRGGLGTIANELAQASGLGLLLDDDAIPVDPMVRGACDMLGIDPLYVANEGCFMAVLDPGYAGAAVAALHQAGAPRAGVIGEITTDLEDVVAIRNAFGGTRLVDMLIGDPLPRIC
ncbi:MAG: hydrogenase expression/formation protein HypE [Actinomycetia bacterium]|nr:hydrogenase expression/formation protein HypE [Actinomycetes bacterium]